MYRILLSCASSMVHRDLFEPGEYTLEDAQEYAGRIMTASPGVEAYVVQSGTDPSAYLHERGLV